MLREHFSGGTKVKMKKITFLVLFLFVGFIGYFLSVHAHFDWPQKHLPTYYEYATRNVLGHSSNFKIDTEQLNKWIAPLEHYFKTHQTSYNDRLRFYTYYFAAQRDAANLTYNTHQAFLGSLDPLNKRAIQTFFPDFEDFPATEEDPYSEKLALIVWQPFLQRLTEENQRLDSWTPSEGIEEAINWLPWFGPVRGVPPPPYANNPKQLTQELKDLKMIRRKMAKNAIQSASSWNSRQHPSFNWFQIAQAYMDKNKVPLEKRLMANAYLSMALYDTAITVIKAKNQYRIERPGDLDPSIKPLLTLKSPSYPSGHAAEGGAAAEVLAYFFPEDSPYWNRLSHQEGQSRLWAGVHVPLDIEEGEKVGRQTAKKGLESL